MFSALFENVINDEFLITLGTGKFEKTFKNSKESMKYIQLNSNDSTKKNSMKNSNQTRKRSQIMLIVFYNLKLSEIAQNIMFHKTIIDLLKKPNKSINTILETTSTRQYHSFLDQELLNRAKNPNFCQISKSNLKNPRSRKTQKAHIVVNARHRRPLQFRGISNRGHSSSCANSLI